jgi:hydrogenase maturation protein HypF
MIERRRVMVQGAVQGVGFRPFVFRLATELNLGGWVENSPQGVEIEVEANPSLLDVFLTRLQGELPAPGSIQHLDWQVAGALGQQRRENRRNTA